MYPVEPPSIYSGSRKTRIDGLLSCSQVACFLQLNWLNGTQLLVAQCWHIILDILSLSACVYTCGSFSFTVFYHFFDCFIMLNLLVHLDTIEGAELEVDD